MEVKTAIKKFDGKYRFLSNFWPAKVHLDGVSYPSVEHAYQAAKTHDPAMRRFIADAPSPGEAKRRGRMIKDKRPDWDDTKLSAMEILLQRKFSPILNPELSAMLKETGDAELIEGNGWGDIFWGVCAGVGENHLGKLLMKVREEL